MDTSMQKLYSIPHLTYSFSVTDRCVLFTSADSYWDKRNISMEESWEAKVPSTFVQRKSHVGESEMDSGLSRLQTDH